MIRLRFFVQVIFALLGGLLLALYLVQHDASLKLYLERACVQTFREQFGCEVQARIKEVSWWGPVIEIEDFGMAPCADRKAAAWWWETKRFIASCSWLSYLQDGLLALHVTLEGARVYSQVTGGMPVIADHLHKLFFADIQFPLTIKSVTLQTAEVVLEDPECQLRLTATISGSCILLPGNIKTAIRIHDGTCTYKNSILCTSLQQMIMMQVPQPLGQQSKINFFGTYGVPTSSGLLQYHCSGRFEGSRGVATIYSHDHAFSLDPIEIECTTRGFSLGVQGKSSLAHVTNLFGFSPSLLSGNLRLDGSVDIEQDSTLVQGACSVDDVRVYNCPVGSWRIEYGRTDGSWSGTFTALSQGQEIARGSWGVDEEQQRIHVHCANDAKLPLPLLKHWHIKPYDGTLDAFIHCKKEGIISCSLHAENEKTEAACNVYAQAQVKDGTISITGAAEECPFMCQFQYLPELRLEQFTLHDQQGNPLCMMKENALAQDAVTLQLHVPLIKRLVQEVAGFSFAGQALLEAHFKPTDVGHCVRLHMYESTVRAPQTYNFIRDIELQAAIDWSARTVVLHDACVSLHKGTVCCSRGTFMFDPMGTLVFCHVPVKVSKLFLHSQKDLFGMASGSVTGIYDAMVGQSVKGCVTLDRVQIKNNPLASSTQSLMINRLLTATPASGLDTTIAISCRTKTPIQIKTPFMDAQLNGLLSIAGTVRQPKAYGTIDVTQGTVIFPYRPLQITSGKLMFVSQQPNDPFIELIARGKIKKYHVTLRVEGSMSNPSIVLESMPPLSEEQILTLLISGSDEGSLALAMPALVMHNVPQLLGMQRDAGDSIFKQILKPFKLIRFVPSFSDQTARGGFRAAIVMDISDRFHGIIQKNFALTEDTRIEMEYQVSDEISVRGIKDERNDLGGEIETRWKF